MSSASRKLDPQPPDEHPAGNRLSQIPLRRMAATYLWCLIYPSQMLVLGWVAGHVAFILLHVVLVGVLFRLYKQPALPEATPGRTLFSIADLKKTTSPWLTGIVRFAVSMLVVFSLSAGLYWLLKASSMLMNEGIGAHKLREALAMGLVFSAGSIHVLCVFRPRKSLIVSEGGIAYPIGGQRTSYPWSQIAGFHWSRWGGKPRLHLRVRLVEMPGPPQLCSINLAGVDDARLRELDDLLRARVPVASSRAVVHPPDAETVESDADIPVTEKLAQYLGS